MNLKVCIVLLSMSVNLTRAQSNSKTPIELSLAQAVNYALENSYESRIAQNDIKIAIKKKWETTAISLPKISATAGYNNNIILPINLIPAEAFGGPAGEFVEVAFGTRHNINAMATAEQLIFDSSYLVGLQSAKVYLKIYEKAKEKTNLEVRESVIYAYGNVLLSEESIKILELNRDNLEKNLFQTKEIFKNGLNQEEDVEQLQITLSTIETQLKYAIQTKDIAYDLLNITLGNDISQELILSNNLEDLANSFIQFDLLNTDVSIENLVDYQLVANDTESKRLLIKLEKSNTLPTLRAFINFGYTGNNEHFNFHKRDQQWFDASTFGMVLNIPIFSSFMRRAKTQQAKISLNSAELIEDQVSQKLKQELASAKSKYQLKIEQYSTAKVNLKLAERIEKKQQVKFFEGISTSFDLTQAQNQLYSQQNNYLRAMLDVITSKAALDKAINSPINKN